MAQKDLVRAFVNGATHGTASNMQIKEDDHGGTNLVGYGWAVYAHRSAKGRVTVYEGWRQWAKDKPGHSGQSTIQHISLIANAAGPRHIKSDRKPECDKRPHSAVTMRSPRA